MFHVLMDSFDPTGWSETTPFWRTIERRRCDRAERNGHSQHSLAFLASTTTRDLSLKAAHTRHDMRITIKISKSDGLTDFGGPGQSVQGRPDGSLDWRPNLES